MIPDTFNPVLTSMDNLMFRLSPCITLFFLKLFIDACSGASEAEINNHLEMGGILLARGQFSDALSHYHAAVEGDPNNFLTYFKRGTVYLAQGKAKNALSDFDRALELKPDFTLARVSRGNVHLKQGKYDQAQLDYYNVLRQEPHNFEAEEQIQKIAPAEQALQYAKAYIAHEEWEGAIQQLTNVIETSPWSGNFRELRAECYLARDDVMAAIADLRGAAKLESAGETETHLKLAKLLYETGRATDALQEIRECLKLDPEHKECFPFYKKVKKIEKALTEAENYHQNKQYRECIEAANKVLKLEPGEPMIELNAKRLLCAAYSKEEESSKALEMCNEVLDIVQDADLFCDRAEAYLQSELYDDAIRDFRSALEQDENSSRAKEGLQRAQRMQAQSERRDYYKILGVKRTATKKEIVKAYRKAAQKWHPDNFQGEEKKKAEKKFIDIAAAKEVLTDEEKRRQYDSGEDPLDPEQGRHGPGGGFQHFHHFQYGSPFQFRFHFN